MAFQAKARQRMQEMMATARLMVVVSHDLDSLASITNRVIWMEHGAIRMEGRPKEVIAAYRANVAPPDAAHPVGAGTTDEPARVAA